MILSILKDEFSWSIPLLVVLLVVALSYWFYTNKVLKRKFDHSKQPILFIVGLCLLYLLKGSPLTILSHMTFSTHMLEMSIFYFYIPPLLLLGIPKTIIHTFLVLMKNSFPLLMYMSLVLFGIGLFFYHFPPTAIWIMGKNPLNDTFLWILFVFALFMWGPICIHHQRLEKWPLKKISYSSASAMLITPACLLLILLPFHSSMNPLFFHMSEFCIPQDYLNTLLPFPFNTKFDQQIAGLFMLIMHKCSIWFISSFKRTFHKKMNPTSSS